MHFLLVCSLYRAGHEVSSVCDGFEALSDIADGDFELLVTGIVMPCMDGFKLVRRTRFEIPSLKVIFITEFAVVALNSQAPKNTDTRVLSKPFHLHILVHEIDRVLAVV